MKRAAWLLLSVAVVGVLLWRLDLSRRERERNLAAAATPAQVVPAPAAPSGGEGGAARSAAKADPGRATELLRLAYAQAWSGAQAAALAEFRDWAERYRSAGSAAERAVLEPTGLALARARRSAMRKLMQHDPALALALTPPAKVRQLLPAAILAELEARFSLVGDFSVMVFDYGPEELKRRRLAGLPLDVFKRFVTLNGEEVPAAVYGRRAGETTKQGIPLHGLVLDGFAALHEGAIRVLEPGESGGGAGVWGEVGGKLVHYASASELLQAEVRFEAAEKGLGPVVRPLAAEGTPSTASTPSTLDETAALAPTAWTIGNKKVLIIRVDFSDYPGDPVVNGTTYTAAYMQNLADTQVSPYYLRSSYGKSSLTNTVTTQLYRLPRTAASYATTGPDGANGQLHLDAQAAAAAHYTLANYDRLVVCFRPLGAIANSKITYGGLATVGASRVWVNGEFDFRVLAHELGHTYGLYHANLWQVADGDAVSASGTSTEYGDGFDTMGANSTNDQRTDFNPWFKNLLGWATDSQVQTVTAVGTYRVNRFDNSTGTGTLALKIPRDATRSYWVGVRRSFTTNASMQNGAYLIWGYDLNRQSNLLDLTTPGVSSQDAALAVGATLTDTVGNLSIRIVTAGGATPDEYVDVLVTPGLNGIPVVAVPPQSQFFFVGDPIDFSVTVTGTAPFTYQWRKNGVDLAGATGSTYAIASAQPADVGAYTVRIANAVGSVVSEGAALTLNAPPAITSPPVNLTTYAGATATLTLGVSSGPALSYQWRKDGAAIAGATTATLTLNDVQAADAGGYDVVVTNFIGSATSAAATLTVNAAGAIPSNDNFASAWTLPGNVGTATDTTVGATGETGEPAHYSGGSGGTATSVWFRWTPSASGAAQIDTIGSSADAGAAFDTVMAVYTGSSLTGLTKLAADDDSGINHNSKVTLNVTAGTTYSIIVGGYEVTDRGSVVLNYTVAAPPSIASQPVDETVNPGGSATFTVVAGGVSPLTYQWAKNAVEIAGAVGATLALTHVQAADAGSYSVAVSNGTGSVTSRAATLSVREPPTIVTQPPDQTANAGGSVAFTVIATGTAPLSYQWRKDGTAIGGATEATLDLSVVGSAAAGGYDVVVSNAAGTVTSRAATLAVHEAPAITTQPVNQTVVAGGTIQFSVVATGLPTPTYQWRKGTVAIAGANSATLLLSDVQATDAGSYDVVVANSVGGVASSAAVLTVQLPPSIASPPASSVVRLGQSATFAVAASGTAPLSYQWQKDGIAVSGETSATLTLTSVQLADAAGYTVVVTNGAGSVTSAAAALAVVDAAQATVGDGYTAGGPITIANTLTYRGALTGVGWQVLLPAGWSYAAGAGQQGDVRPTPGATDLAEWQWTSLPAGPVSFTYTLAVPADTTGTQTLSARLTGQHASVAFDLLVLPEPLSIGPASARHSADTNKDGQLSLSELLRVIELYNTRNGTTRTGRYAVEVGTEDGFATDALTASDATVTLAAYHSGDANRDGKFSLSELLRVIELYNSRNGTTRTGQYHALRSGESATEDGFAPGA